MKQVLIISPYNLLRFTISVWGWQLLSRHFPTLSSPVWEPGRWWHQDADIKLLYLYLIFCSLLFPTSIAFNPSHISIFHFPCYLSFSFLMHLSLSLPPPPFFQRRVLRPGTVFSVRSRSWWRRSSRLPACGRVRATAEGSSWPTKTQEVAPAVASAP